MMLRHSPDDKRIMSADQIQAPSEIRTFNLSLAHSRYIDGLLESGAYLSASEVLRAGLRALHERDEAIDRWLSEDVASVLDAVQAEQRRPVPAAAVFAAVRARYADRRKKNR